MTGGTGGGGGFSGAGGVSGAGGGADGGTDTVARANTPWLALKYVALPETSARIARTM